MKKRITALIILLCVGALFLTSCGKEENPDTLPDNEIAGKVDKSEGKNDTTEKKPDKKAEKEEGSLAELRAEIADKSAFLGIAYLGYSDGAFDDIRKQLSEMTLCEAYPFLNDITADALYKTESNELYLAVPADKNATVEIYSAVLNESTYELERGELLGKSENGKPFLLSCNVSEIMPNVIISTEGIDYSPSLSGENGKVVTIEGVYDFTPYNIINEYFGLDNNSFVADGADSEFCGFWMGDAEDGDYVVNTLALTLTPDGTAEYIYGIGNSEPTEGFEGTWSYDSERDMILLDMFGGPFDDYLDSDEKYIVPYKLECGFKWDVEHRDDGICLILTHEEGNPILWGKNGATFELYDATSSEEDYSYLVGSWGIISEIRETYLELFDNGQAHYYVKESDTVTKEVYGLWEAEGLTLYLNLQGHYDDSEAEKVLISGEYGIKYDGELLTLSMLSEATDPLTAFMMENGYDSFILCGVG